MLGKKFGGAPLRVTDANDVPTQIQAGDAAVLKSLRVDFVRRGDFVMGLDCNAFEIL